MYSLLKALTAFGPAFKKLGICATLGFIAGVIAGFFLLLFFLVSGGTDPMLTQDQILKVVLLLTIFDVIALLFFLVGLSRYTFAAAFLPTLITSLLVCLVTVLLVSKFNLWLLSLIVGMLVGLIIGRLLCLLFCRFPGEKQYGLR